MMRLIVTSVAAILGLAGAAAGNGDFPFARSVERLDLSTADAGARFQQIVEGVAKTPLVYLDWQFAGFLGNEVFGSLAGDSAGDDAEGVACDALAQDGAPGPLTGRPNAENNHLLLGMDLPIPGDDPFDTAACEFFNGAPSGQGLRIRGFFYVADIKTATADQYWLRPVSVDATSIPQDFLKPAE
ncbi:hypothetical protein RM190_09505 [Paracoccus sp. CPCC 101403]|uniref:Uncharacterized protein n=1 Tax=Paracoccus broussonetiae TaxID=3075834 RepID=A0ABU3EE47_9RHOB|nr:hypothetical protein [Paracoccus sp. CPCC 101403]MDT1062092.1 hypothetical protein [Paracoccus sp. CPCC 101403]